MPPIPQKQTPTVGAKKPVAKLPEADAWGQTDTIQMLVYGQSGSGKTTLWGTFPGRTLALLCSGGKRPGELKSIDTPENRKRITPKIITNLDQFKGYLEGADKYDTVVIDHISGLQDLNLMEIMGITEIPDKKDWGFASGDQYGQSNRQVITMLKALLNLPTNLVLVGQERTFQGKEDGGTSDVISPVVAVNATPGVNLWLAPALDYIVQTFKRPKMVTREVVVGKNVSKIQERGEGIEFCLRTGPHDIFLTKFRKPKSRVLPDVLVDPSYEKLMKIIKGGA